MSCAKHLWNLSVRARTWTYTKFLNIVDSSRYLTGSRYHRYGMINLCRYFTGSIRYHRFGMINLCRYYTGCRYHRFCMINLCGYSTGSRYHRFGKINLCSYFSCSRYHGFGMINLCRYFSVADTESTVRSRWTWFRLIGLSSLVNPKTVWINLLLFKAWFFTKRGWELLQVNQLKPYIFSHSDRVNFEIFGIIV